MVPTEVLDFSLAYLLAYNNLWLCYYERVKIFGGTIYFAVDGKLTYHYLKTRSLF